MTEPNAPSDSSARHRAVLLFGPPGSGKGTQGQTLGSVPGFVHVSMGDVFRGLERTSELGRIFDEHSSKGELVPDDVTIRIWDAHMESLQTRRDYRPGRDLVVLDGIPRSVNQAELLEEQVEVLMILHLMINDVEPVIERLRKRAMRQNRTDDAKVEVIRRRFEVYDSETAPVLSHYPKELVRRIEAMGTPARVLLRILEHAAPLQESRVGNPL